MVCTRMYCESKYKFGTNILFPKWSNGTNGSCCVYLHHIFTYTGPRSFLTIEPSLSVSHKALKLFTVCCIIIPKYDFLLIVFRVIDRMNFFALFYLLSSARLTLVFSELTYVIYIITEIFIFW